MAKKVDITSKLEMDGNPYLVVGDKELEVNADAGTVLMLMGKYGDAGEQTTKDVLEMYELIFPEDARADIKEMKLSFADLRTIIQEGIKLILGEDEEENSGEIQTPVMI